ncbi:MAG: SRPBCC domain-containing protein [Planctomycetota bacterium]
MTTRSHVHEESFTAAPAALFALLHTPSAIRDWWGAARAVVIAEFGGAWAAAWGESEDQPDYITVATIAEFDPPRRLVLSDYRYHNAAGPLPFEANFVTTFEVEPAESGATLRVTQSGFPAGPEADDFYQGCDAGWRATFEGIRRVAEGRE